MDLTTLAIAKKFSGNSSSGGSNDNSNVLWFEVIFPENPGNETSIPVDIDISWNTLWEAYLDDAIIIPYIAFASTMKCYFNLVMREDNKLIFSCNTVMDGDFVNYTLTITQDQAILSVTEFSNTEFLNGDEVLY